MKMMINKTMKMMIIDETLKMKPYMKKKTVKMKTYNKTCKANKTIETDDTTKLTYIIVDVRTNFAEKSAFWWIFRIVEKVKFFVRSLKWILK